MRVLQIFILAAAFSQIAYSQVPQRRSGLWEETETSSLFPRTVTKALHCIESATDRIDLEMRDGGTPGTCGSAVVTRTADVLTITKRCKYRGSDVTAPAVIRGELATQCKEQFMNRLTPLV